MSVKAIGGVITHTDTGYGCGGGGGLSNGGGLGHEGIVIVRYLYSATSGRPANVSKIFGKSAESLNKVGGIPIENIKSIMGVQ